jgi:hypothetical protein
MLPHVAYPTNAESYNAGMQFCEQEDQEDEVQMPEH